MPRMSMAPEISMLRDQPLFVDMDPVRLEVLAFTSERRHYATGDYVFEEGDFADGAFLLISGEAVLLDHDGAGHPRATRLMPGDLIGEHVLFAEGPWQTTMRAVGAIETLRISRDVFHRLMGEFPEMAGQVARSLADRLANIGDTLSALSKKAAPKGK
ncbi:MAG: cyclic nucleotide-binding domain-containing protein [Rhizobiales bacterium]|nr:cyclic nucleotide-binding domain-containing protein [Hyphomicrobiales bacterium]